MTTTIITVIFYIILLAVTIGAYKWLKKSAAEDKLFVCFVPLNEAVGIRRGGAFHRFLFDPTGGTHLNDPHSWQFDSEYRAWERLSNRWEWHKVKDHWCEYKDERNWFTRFTGIYFFIPFVEEVDKYPFDWTTYLKTEIDSTGKKVHQTKPHEKTEVRSIYIKAAQYYGQVMVLTQDGIDVLVNFTFDVEVINPFVARFARGNFLGQVKSRLEAELKNYVGDQTFSELFSEDDSKKAGSTDAKAKAGGHGRFYEGFVKILNDHTEKDPKTGETDESSPGIEAIYGVKITAAHILDIQDPTGHSAEQVEARQKLEIAKQGVKIAKENADAKATEGDGIRRHNEAVNAAEIARAKALMDIRTGKEAAVKIAVAEALFANAKVVSVGKGGLKGLIDLKDLDSPTAPPRAAASAAVPTIT